MDAKTTGRLIAVRRKEKGISQAELADMLHVTDKAISRWETGRGMPAVETLEPLASALDLSVSELLGGKEIPGEHAPSDTGSGRAGLLALWPYYLLAAMAAVGIVVGAFQAKIHLIPGDVEITGHTLLLGVVCGVIVSVVLLCLKKRRAQSALAASLLLLWLVMPGDLLVSPVVLGGGGICCIAAIPCMAVFLAALSKRGIR